MTTIRAAAAHFGVSARTIRRWRQGMACKRGEVSIEALEAQKTKTPVLAALNPSLLLDYLRRNSAGDVPAHQFVGISEKDAAAYLALLWRYVYIREHGVEPESYPPEIEHLVSVTLCPLR